MINLRQGSMTPQQKRSAYNKNEQTNNYLSCETSMYIWIKMNLKTKKLNNDRGKRRSKLKC